MRPQSFRIWIDQGYRLRIRRGKWHRYGECRWSVDSVVGDAVQPSVRLRTRNRLETGRRRWLSKGAKVATAEEHWISSQFICLWESEGRSKFRSRQARNSSLSSGAFVGWWRMSLEKLLLATREDRKASSARSVAVRRPRPPYRTGSLACDQLLSSKWMLHNASDVERVSSSYSARSSGWWWHGAVRWVGRRRGREKAFFSRMRPGRPSSKRMRSIILYDAASRCIIQNRRSKKFHLGKLGHLEFWE